MANNATITWDQITNLTTAVNQLTTTLNQKNALYQDGTTPIIKGIQDVSIIATQAKVTFTNNALTQDVIPSGVSGTSAGTIAQNADTNYVILGTATLEEKYTKGTYNGYVVFNASGTATAADVFTTTGYKAGIARLVGVNPDKNTPITCTIHILYIGFPPA